MGAKHWSEADYYRASRRARAAWEATQPQLTLEGLTAGVGEVSTHERAGGSASRATPAVSPSGLEGADAGTTSLVASAPSSPNDGLAAAEREGVLDTVRTVGLPCSAAASPPSPHADAARTSGSHSSGRGEGGLDFKRVWYKGRWVCPECEETDGHLPDCVFFTPRQEN